MSSVAQRFFLLRKEKHRRVRIKSEIEPILRVHKPINLVNIVISLEEVIERTQSIFGVEEAVGLVYIRVEKGSKVQLVWEQEKKVDF